MKIIDNRFTKTTMKKTLILISVILVGIVNGCSDEFLEAQPKAALTEGALQNAKGVNSLLIGAYSLLDGWATAEGAYRSYQVGADNWVYGSVASDDAYKGTIAGDQPPISLWNFYQDLRSLIHLIFATPKLQQEVLQLMQDRSKMNH